MRYLSLSVAALILVHPCSATSADRSQDLARCTAEKNGVTRLACYDTLARKAVVQDDAARATSTVSKWKVRTETSLIDDSNNVTVSLVAESRIEGWPSQTKWPVLTVRCGERKTEAYVVTGMAPAVEYEFNTATVTLRLDKQPAFKIKTSKSTDSEALFFPQAASFAKRLVSAESMLFEFIPFNSSGQMTTFDIRGLADALKPLRAACKW